MTALIVAAALAGTFFGAALYINLAEHPARITLGTAFAVREFGPSYRRAATMQATLAAVGTLTALGAAWDLGDGLTAGAGLLLGLVIPFTLIVIFPTNKRLLDPTLNPDSEIARSLLERWNRLHWVRTMVSGAAFALLLFRLASR